MPKRADATRKELLEQQLQVSSLQEISKYLLAKGDRDYTEAHEKVHIIGKKLNQLLDQVYQYLESLKGSQDEDTTLTAFDNIDSSGHYLSSKSVTTEQEKARAERITEEKSKKNIRVEHLSEPASTLTSSGPHSFLYRVFRAALYLQLFFLLLLLLAYVIPSSEEDYCCTRVNNFEVHQWAPTNIEWVHARVHPLPIHSGWVLKPWGP
ncbi:nesprin-2-like [Petaurus breviceps papuanus]|uniref:nesprin-2-like n=1 Tax=Petaurus breviceps papuanus TaxID=3040969 RepID=UPI0036DEFDF7